MNYKLPGFSVLITAIIMHLIFGVVLILSPHLILTTPTSFALHYLTQDGAGLAYLAAAVLGLWGLSKPGKGLVAMVPQMVLLYAAAIAAVSASLAGIYPDGTVVTSHFIFVDQLLVMLFALAHGWMVLVYHGRARWKQLES